MAAIASPVLQLQRDHTNRPYGGGWWPSASGTSHELIDLVSRWPADKPSIVRYAFIDDAWDRAETTVPQRYRTRTMVLALSDRSTCRLLVLPPDTPVEIAQRFLDEASDPHTRWLRTDFVSTFRTPTPREEPVLKTEGSRR